MLHMLLLDLASAYQATASSSNRAFLQSWMPISNHSTVPALQQQVANPHLHSLLSMALQRHCSKHKQLQMPQLQLQEHRQLLPLQLTA
jgi:hypothetical protein